MFRISILYPNDGGKFDLSYYLSEHIVLVHKLLKPYGLVRTEVDRGLGTNMPRGKAPFVAIGYLYFNTFEELEQGMKTHDPDLAADIINFTNIRPVIQISEIIEQ
jgi:uncharacterized protein (TIGR02118 family)